MKVMCCNCNEVTETPIYFIPNMVQDLQGSKGQANYVAKCKLCERTSSIEFIQSSYKAYSLNEEWGDVATFECRGWEPVEFFPGDRFTA